MKNKNKIKNQGQAASDRVKAQNNMKFKKLFDA